MYAGTVAVQTFLINDVKYKKWVKKRKIQVQL